MITAATTVAAPLLSATRVSSGSTKAAEHSYRLPAMYAIEWPGAAKRHGRRPALDAFDLAFPDRELLGLVQRFRSTDLP